MLALVACGDGGNDDDSGTSTAWTCAVGQVVTLSFDGEYQCWDTCEQTEDCPRPDEQACADVNVPNICMTPEQFDRQTPSSGGRGADVTAIDVEPSTFSSADLQGDTDAFFTVRVELDRMEARPERVHFLEVYHQAESHTEANYRHVEWDGETAVLTGIPASWITDHGPGTYTIGGGIHTTSGGSMDSELSEVEYSE